MNINTTTYRNPGNTSESCTVMHDGRNAFVTYDDGEGLRETCKVPQGRTPTNFVAAYAEWLTASAHI